MKIQTLCSTGCGNTAVIFRPFSRSRGVLAETYAGGPLCWNCHHRVLREFSLGAVRERDRVYAAKRRQDPGVRSRHNAAQRKHYAQDPERHRADQRAYREAHPDNRTTADRHHVGHLWDAYVGSEPRCDLCGTTKAKRWSIDHDKSHHPGDTHGCAECVRALLCYPCNVAEGFIRRLIRNGGVTSIAGPIEVLLGPLEDTPFQRWLRKQGEVAA